jgi:hypothetical protein
VLPAVLLTALTAHVHDWFAMTNELLYERRAISVAETLSPLPRLHGQSIPSYDQLYSLLIAPAFRHGPVAHDLVTAHRLGAWLMASAAVPAFLLARRVTASSVLAAAVGLLAVCIPWIVFASFLLTEVVAYPAFLWAMLAFQRAVSAPSARRDLLALAAVVVAFFARTQFALLAILLPIVVLAYELGRSRGVMPAARDAIARHRVLAGAYVLLVALAVGLAAVGRLSHVLGVYEDTIRGNLLPNGIGRSLVEHLATLALGVGILPLVVGLSWLVANLVRPPQDRELHAFACVGGVIAIGQLLQVTTFDLRFGGEGGFVHDRYLFYLAPLLVLAFVAAVREARIAWWATGAVAVLVALGFAVGALPRFVWHDFPQINSDAPALTLLRPVVQLAHGLTGARIVLVTATLVSAALFAFARRRRLRGAIAVVSLAIVPVLTAYMFARLLGVEGWANRPLTGPEHGVYDWVDGATGGAQVAMVPYPVSTAFLVSQRIWRDYEFWNKTVDRDVQYTGPWRFKYTGDTFPQRLVRIDPSTGHSAGSPAGFVLQADQDARFRISGVAVVENNGVRLIRAERPWRVDWLTFGLYPDGWTRPGKTAVIRVFPAPGQRGPVTRTLTVGVRTTEDVSKRPFSLRSNMQQAAAVAAPETARATVSVCVPAHGYTEARVRVRGRSTIPGDLRYYELAEGTRRVGGAFVDEVALADEIGAPCRP